MTKNEVGDDVISSVAFFAFVFALTLTVWSLGAAVDLSLMPGLPLSSRMVFL